MNSVTYKQLFQRYRNDGLLNKHEKYAYWTVPSVFTVESDPGVGGNIDVQHDFQSLGAILVNHCAAKLTGLLFPQHINFFRIDLTAEVLEAVRGASTSAQKSGKQRLMQLETAANAALTTNGGYAQLVYMLLLLIITGNALIIKKADKLLVKSLRNYSYLRDTNGNIVDLVVRESMFFSSLPVDVQAVLRSSGKDYKFDTPVEVYTRVEYTQTDNGKMATISLSVEDTPFGEPEKMLAQFCPYIPAVLQLRDGDNYGTGMVADYAGGFAKLSAISEALAMYELEACKVINLIKPGAVIDLEALQNATHGDFVLGDPSAIQKLETGNVNKIAQLLDDINSVFSQLSKPFLYEGNVRDAERVTAEEIRLLAEEADRNQGGIYSSLSTVHVPLAHVLCYQQDPEFLVALTAKEVKLSIATGLAALGRSMELRNLMQALGELAQIVPAMQQLSQRFDTERTIDEVLISRGIDPSNYMLDEAALRQKQEQLAEQAALEQQNIMAAQGQTQGM